MNTDFVEKNIEYQEQVEQIAKFVFHAFYYDEEEKATYVSGPDLYERELIGDLLHKGEKIYGFFGSATEAKKALRFLHTVNPMKAKEILDEL